MPSILSAAAKLYQITARASDAPIFSGTVRGCILRLREIPQAERRRYVALLHDGTRLSAERLESIAAEQRG